jgi:hypothetical protein
MGRRRWRIDRSVEALQAFSPGRHGNPPRPRVWLRHLRSAGPLRFRRLDARAWRVADAPTTGSAEGRNLRLVGGDRANGGHNLCESHRLAETTARLCEGAGLLKALVARNGAYGTRRLWSLRHAFTIPHRFAAFCVKRADWSQNGSLVPCCHTGGPGSVAKAVLEHGRRGGCYKLRRRSWQLVQRGPRHEP